MTWTHDVVAHNTATESTNRMHDDTVAATYGFRGGLVPGVDVWAYATRPCVDRWGLAFLERGSLEMRFASPVYDGEAVGAAADPARYDGRDRGGVDRHFVCAAGEQLADVFHRAHAAADGERHEARLSRARHDVVDSVAVLMACGDIEEAQFIRACCIVDARLFHRISGVHQVNEAHPIDDPPSAHVKAGNNSNFQHIGGSLSAGRRSSSASACATSIRPS